MRRSAPGATATGSRYRWRCSVAPCGRRCPRPCASEGGELSGYIYVDLADGTDIEGYVARARRDVEGRRGPAAAGRRAPGVDRAVPAAEGGTASPAAHRAAGRAADAGVAVLSIPQPDRGAAGAGVGPVRAGRQLLDAVPARLPPVRAGLGGAAVGGRPGDADRRGHGRLHRRRVLSPRARGQAAHAATTSSRPTPRARCSGCAPS